MISWPRSQKKKGIIKKRNRGKKRRKEKKQKDDNERANDCNLIWWFSPFSCLTFQEIYINVANFSELNLECAHVCFYNNSILISFIFVLIEVKRCLFRAVGIDSVVVLKCLKRYFEDVIYFILFSFGFVGDSALPQNIWCSADYMCKS